MRLLTLVLTLIPTLALASGGGPQLMPARTDISDKASLQNGAKLFVNYCMGCHSAEFMRFSRIGQDLGLSDADLKQNLMFAADKVGEPMRIGMSKDAAVKFFGIMPPDLSVVARARGVDWLYTYLMGFYLDPSRSTGVNNLVFKDVGMPHVLWEMQGWQKPVYKTETGHDGKPHQVLEKLEAADKDTLKPEQLEKRERDYRRNMRDLVAFLEYVGEPAKIHRTWLGFWVIVFLFFFLGVSYMLKKEYWKDVH
jgi:ubiquinol-cytochrome c reductase cytochrome c1 subunit